MLLARLRAVDDEAFDGWAHQFHIVTLRSLNRQADWHPMSLCEEAAFDPALATIGGIRASFFPAQRSRCRIAPSILNQSQSIPRSSSNCSTPARHNLRKTPAFTHS